MPLPDDLRFAPVPLRDAERVAEVLRASGVFSAEEVEVAGELLHAAQSDGSTPPDYVFLGAFTPEDRLAGFACYGPTPGTDRTHDLYWIAVDPALGRSGIASHLMHEVERRLQGQTARLVVVETSSRSDYAPARAFYARRGYAEVARIPGFYAPGDDRIILTKRIHSPPGRGALSA